jgi:hypothetical protein
VAISSAITSAPIAVLTGAGASVPLGLKTTRDFVDHFIDTHRAELNKVGGSSAVGELVRMRPKDPARQKDIEQLLDEFESRIEAIRTLQSDPAFAVDVIGAQNGIEERLKDFLRVQELFFEKIRGEIIEHYGNVAPEAAAQLYRGLLGGFSSWFRDIPGISRTLPFFTLNYDTAIEFAVDTLSAEAPNGDGGRIRLIDGFDRQHITRRWSRTAFENYRETPDELNVVLIKLHGSASWAYRGRDEATIIEIAPGMHRDPPPYTHTVLYPTARPKPTSTEPFSTGYECLHECVRTAKLLIVIGTSFRDAEINREIAAGMRENPSLRIVAVGPVSCPPKYSIHCEKVAGLVPSPGRSAAARNSSGVRSSSELCGRTWL